MAVLDIRRLKNRLDIEAIIEANETARRGGDCSNEVSYLGAVISEINRTGAQEDPRKQKEIIEKVRRKYGYK